MTDKDLLDTIQKLMESNQVDQSTVNQMLLAILLEERSRQSTHQQHTAERLARLETMIETHARACDQLATAVAKLTDYQQQHPTLIYLLRYRTRETTAAIILLFILLSLWYVSGIRQPILKFLGLPEF